MWGLREKKVEMPAAEQALPGRSTKMPVPVKHFVLEAPLEVSEAELERLGLAQAMFGLGCFWGAEKRFWQAPGVVTTAVGYAGGFTPNPSYEEVCSGLTGHNEVVWVVFDPKLTSYEALLKVFWEAHDPTQGMRQGNDVGTQYRSGIYTYGAEQARLAKASEVAFQRALGEAGRGAITTEVVSAPPFYFAEGYHQQYLAKNPNGYCGLGGTGVCMPPLAQQ
jgi:peptide-methionine (S)-S-oxide reductase